MKKLLLNAKFILVMLTGLSAVSANGQSDEISKDIKTHFIKSGYNKKEYCLQVLLPKNYTKADTVKYPVLYVLDGKYSTYLFYSMLETYALGKELKDLIVVTIDGKNLSASDWLTSRYHDYTPSANPLADTAIAQYFKTPVSNSGGASAFLATLEKEIIPLIDHNYKTNNERGIFGHSLGGLFAGYCLITRPSLFQHYSMNSPSFWWNNGEMAGKIDSLALKNINITADIFISAGVLEGEFMIAPVTKCAESLKNNFPDTKITNKVFDDETHLSAVAVACSRTLRMFYAPKMK